MALKVVDASAFAAIAFGEPERRSVLEDLEGHELLSTRLFAYELTNIAWKKVRQRQATAEEISPRLLDALRGQVELSEVDFGVVFELALDTGLSAYDASYLWLAEALDAELVTLDGRLGAVYASRR